MSVAVGYYEVRQRGILPHQTEEFRSSQVESVALGEALNLPRGRRFKSCPRYEESPGQPQVDLDFFVGGIMRSHQETITLAGAQRRPDGSRGRWFRSLRVRSARLVHLLGMSTTKLGLEPLMRVDDLADYLGVPVQTIYDWRLSGRAPRACKFGKHLRFAVSDVQEWLEQRHEGGAHE